jgi:excisionase family DNA binding protein
MSAGTADRNLLAGSGESRSLTTMASNNHPPAPGLPGVPPTNRVDRHDTRELAAELATLIGQQATPPLLDSGQAAAILNVPRSWIAAEARAGRIPHVRLGRYVRFNRDELIAWCDGLTRWVRESSAGRQRDGRLAGRSPPGIVSFPVGPRRRRGRVRLGAGADSRRGR